MGPAVPAGEGADRTKGPRNRRGRGEECVAGSPVGIRWIAARARGGGVGRLGGDGVVAAAAGDPAGSGDVVGRASIKGLSRTAAPTKKPGGKIVAPNFAGQTQAARRMDECPPARRRSRTFH